jgi:hypothetical protein
MSKSATRVLTLAIYATALVVVPMIIPAKAATNSSEERKAQEKIQKSLRFSNPRSASQARPVTGPSSQAGGVCAGAARSFDCKQWPPPIDEDPDRKSGGAGGM